MIRDRPTRFDPESFAALLSVETDGGASMHGLDVDAALELARVMKRGLETIDTDEETERRLNSLVRSLENVALEETR